MTSVTRDERALFRANLSGYYKWDSVSLGIATGIFPQSSKSCTITAWFRISEGNTVLDRSMLYRTRNNKGAIDSQ